MIKRVTFANRAPDVARDSFAAAWRDAVAASTSAPPDTRPFRVTVCTALPELTDDEPKHDVIVFEWFSDVLCAERFDVWLGSAGTGTRDGCAVLLVDELVLRGADWLEQRWRDGGESLKHMAIALRAPDLGPAEFSERWKTHAGRLGRAGAPALVIPDAARGQAYVQNHPTSRATDRAYDALNEVYFDDVEGLRGRVDWFRANFDPSADELVRASWFVAAREEVVS